jgi:6,7-dimethyl-8-ribityllumazine synthase
VGADTGKPIVFGVLTTYTTDQAMARADRGRQNLGAEYADTAVEMANLHKALTDL